MKYDFNVLWLTEYSVRLTKILARSFDQDIGTIAARLEHHARVADQTAIATELLRAAEHRKDAERSRREELRIQCNLWLKATEVQNIHERHLRAKLDGTCDWIQTNEVFKRWRSPDDLMLCKRMVAISGIPGCGKSILASAIVDELNKRSQSTLFFSFSSSDGSRKDGGNLVRTFLSQLLQSSAASNVVDGIQRLRLAGEPTTSELWASLEMLIASSTGAIYWVIDTVDECDDFRQTVYEHIARIVEKCPNLRTLMLGRPVAVQVLIKTFELQTIEMKPSLLEHDIEAFIKSEIARSDVLSTTGLQGQIVRELKAQANGMFLWAHFMVEDLRRSSSKSEIEERLRRLPRGLEEAYRLIFSRLSKSLDKFELNLVQKLLSFMIVSYQPLTFDEIRHAYAIHCWSVQQTTSRRPKDYLLLQPNQKVLDLFQNLVIAAEDRFQLIHSSIRDFLTRPEIEWANESDRMIIDFRVDVMETHKSFAFICLDCAGLGDAMSLQQPKSEIWEAETPKFAKQNEALLEYSTIFLFYHLNRSGPLQSEIFDRMTSLLGPGDIAQWLEKFFAYIYKDASYLSQTQEVDDFLEKVKEKGLEAFLFLSLERKLGEMKSQKHCLDQDKTPNTALSEALLEMFKHEIFKKEDDDEDAEEDSKEVAHPVSEGPKLHVETAENQNRVTIPGSVPPSFTKVAKLLQDPKPMPLSSQLELLFRLRTSLRKTRTLTDPLKVLFRLILEKSSSLPVHILMALAGFYQRLGKVEEEREVYQVALYKLNDQEVPLKYDIHTRIADCFYEQGMMEEALKSYQEAFDGQKLLLGERHEDVLNTQYSLAQINENLGNFHEAFYLCKCLFAGQDDVPEFDFESNLNIMGTRYQCSRFYTSVETRASYSQCLRITLEKYRKSNPQNCPESSSSLSLIGSVHFDLEEYKKALEYYQRAVDRIEKEKFKSSKEKRLKRLRFQRRISLCHSNLGYLNVAETMCRKVLAEHKSLVGPKDIDLYYAEECLRSIKRRRELVVRRFPEPTFLGFRRNSCDSFDDFNDSDAASWYPLERRYSADPQYLPASIEDFRMI